MNKKKLENQLLFHVTEKNNPNKERRTRNSATSFSSVRFVMNFSIGFFSFPKYKYLQGNQSVQNDGNIFFQFCLFDEDGHQIFKFPQLLNRTNYYLLFIILTIPGI